MTSPIIDTIPKEDLVAFVPWVAAQGYQIVLSVDGSRIKATLVGTRRAWFCYDGDGISDFIGRGDTREEAIVQLARSCSGGVHHPKATQGFFGVRSGPEYRFPRFI